ncbi:MAG: hypothetical protein IJY91_05285, partial [Oscillospiraceae bacterium]|nr:hypothetical protein [Oscillospiraceae bacterium]
YFPITIISDGKLMPENMSVAGKNRKWVDKVLQEKDARIEDTWLLTVDGGDKILFYRRED